MLYKKYLEEAPKYLKGCLNHFKASVERIARNRKIISIGHVDFFNKAIEAMLAAKSEEELNKSADAILKIFPNCKLWLQW